MPSVPFLGHRQRLQTQNTASGQGLQCLHSEISIKNKIKIKKYTRHPSNKNGLVQLIRMEQSIRLKRLMKKHQTYLFHKNMMKYKER